MNTILAINQKINKYALVNRLIAAVSLQMFFWQLFLGHLSPHGFQSWLMHSKVMHDTHMYMIHHMLMGLAAHPAFSAAALSVLLVLSSIAFCLNSGILSLLGFFMYAFFWVIFLGEKWTFCFLLPAAFSLSQFCYWCSQKNLYTHKKQWILGAKTVAKDLPASLKVGLAAIFLCLFSYVNFMSENGKAMSIDIVLYSSLVVIIFFILDFFLERYKTDVMLKIHQTQWMSPLLSAVGLMLIFQIYQDYALKWWTYSGYQHLAERYAHTRHMPNWMQAFLIFSSHHARWLLPIQVLFETLEGMLLFLGILRLPIAVVTIGFFAILSFSEMGGLHPDWAWELWLSVVVLVIGVMHAIPDSLVKGEGSSRRFWLHRRVGFCDGSLTNFFIPTLFLLFAMNISCYYFAGLGSMTHAWMFAMAIIESLALLVLYFLMNKYRA